MAALIAGLNATNARLDSQLAQVTALFNTSMSLVFSLQQTVAQLQGVIADHNATIATLRSQVNFVKMKTRKLRKTSHLMLS